MNKTEGENRKARIDGSSWFILSFVLMVLMTFSAAAQIQQAWVARYNNGITNGTNQAVKMALDASGNIYVTGFSQNANTNLGYATIKYAPNGNQLWIARYDTTNDSSAIPTGLGLDSSNDVIVTGTVLTIMYDPNGNQLWTAPYAGAALAVDSSGNSVVTGINANFGTVKLNANGSNLWSVTYSSPYGPGLGQQVLCAPDSSVYVAGSYTYLCDEGFCYLEMLVVKYDSAGNQIWAATPFQADVFAVNVAAAALDSSGSFYIVVDYGSGFAKFVTSKYSSDGMLRWSSSPTTYNGSQTHGLMLDQRQDVVLTGQVNYAYNASLGTFSYYYGTFELSTNGATLWSRYFPDPPFSSSVAKAIAIDLGNNVYVTGCSPGTNTKNNIATIKYDLVGTQIWLQRYSSPGNGNAAGNAIAVDNNGNVYVAGYDTTMAGGTEMVLIKYSPVTLQRKPDGTVLLETQGSPGESFDIEASADLLNWLDLGTVLADINGLMQFDDTNAPQYNARFYTTKPQ
jgi:hypothetical protein